MELQNAVAMLKLRYILRVMWVFLIIGGSQKHFHAIVWSLKPNKAQQMLQFSELLREVKDQFSQFDVFINGFMLLPLNGVSTRFFLNHIHK